ncbi:hypothetical protein JX266_003686 [Neoarthrinium moseri]|nr:hypothetical protein JX266_003686 [Neoarthrinium moseri]
MSLGVRSVWRARACASTVGGLSLIPRGVPRGQAVVYPRYDPRRHVSTEPASHPVHEALTTRRPTQPPADPADEFQDVFKEAFSGKSQDAPKDEPATRSRSAFRRAVLRRVIKKRSASAEDSALVKPSRFYPSKHEIDRNNRKRRQSQARQVLWTSARAAEGRLGTNWRKVERALSKLTPKFGTIYDFKVTVGRGAADEVRKFLPRSPTSPGRLQESTRAIVRINDVDEADGRLKLTLTGSEHSVRRALLDLLRASGQISAVRVMDSDSEGMLRDLWRRKDTLRSVELLKECDAVPNDRVLTLHREQSPVIALGSRPKRHNYKLSQRADDIARPAIWTKASLEEYVAALVSGVVPMHLMGSLYPPDGPDHQQTVVSLLVELFQSESLRDSISTEALAMSLAYIQEKHLTFRPAARAIFNQAEISNVPMDTRICNLLLEGSSRSGDIDGFDAVLKMMTRRGYHADSESWLQLLMLVEDAKAKREVLRKMKKKGLNRIESTLAKAGRHMAPFELEDALPRLTSIERFVEQQDMKYDPVWLDAVTLNRLLEILGRNEKHAMVNELLGLVSTSSRMQPDVVAVNTIITHQRNIRDLMETLCFIGSRWPGTRPNQETYHILFRIAWRIRSPNMLRVIWHYACYDRQAGHKMRHQLNVFYRKEENLGRLSLLKTWEDSILGEQALAALRDGGSNSFTKATYAARWHGERSLSSKPEEPFFSKLAEAREMDRRVHNKIKEGEVIAASVRDALTIEIPFQDHRQRSGHQPEGSEAQDAQEI